MALPTAAQLRASGELRKQYSPEQLALAGLTNTEIQMVQLGFSGSFGAGNANEFRKQNSLTLNDKGNVLNAQGKLAISPAVTDIINQQNARAAAEYQKTIAGYWQSISKTKNPDLLAQYPTGVATAGDFQVQKSAVEERKRRLQGAAASSTVKTSGAGVQSTAKSALAQLYGV